MAISRIGGRALKANLERDSDLTFNTDTLAIDYSNSRIGIGTTSPTTALDVSGNVNITGSITFEQISIAGNKIESNTSNANLQLDANGTGTIELKTGATIDGSLTLQSGVSASSILDEDDMNSDSATALSTQQSIKAYVDAQVAGGGVSTGMQITLGTPTDSSLTTDGAYQGFLTGTKVTDAIDDLNEVTENIRNNTFVKSVDFTADQTVGGA